MIRSERLAVLALAVFLGCSGCDQSGSVPAASSSTEKATVKGKLTRKGKPLAKVSIKFDAANINRKSAPTATATTGDDGSFEVTTLAGENLVSLGGGPVAKDTQLQYFHKSVDLQAGSNDVSFDIP